MAYTFGPFQYDAEQKLLFRGSEVVPLVPKVVDTLQALLERRGRVVEKNELIKLVWPDTVVQEGGLALWVSCSSRRVTLHGTFLEAIEMAESLTPSART